MDEVGKQLVKDKRASLSMRPGDTETIDYEYERAGVCTVFVACEPLAGKRYAKVTTQRTRLDWATVLREVIDVQYAKAEKIVLVMDNLTTHSPASFSEAFDPVRSGASV